MSEPVKRGPPGRKGDKGDKGDSGRLSKLVTLCLAAALAVLIGVGVVGGIKERQLVLGLQQTLCEKITQNIETAKVLARDEGLSPETRAHERSLVPLLEKQAAAYPDVIACKITYE